VNKFWNVIKHALVGAMEVASLAIMVGASAVFTPVGTYFIIVGLFIGVVGLAILDVWHV
jgi:hypothetical protein